MVTVQDRRLLRCDVTVCRWTSYFRRFGEPLCLHVPGSRETASHPSRIVRNASLEPQTVWRSFLLLYEDCITVYRGKSDFLKL